MPSTLRFVPYEMPAAGLGPLNPLPDLRGEGDLHAKLGFDETIPEEERASFAYGRVSGILPYMIQDGYDREKRPRAFRAAVLENDHLKATFLPELGGRLWSLFDKDAGRELLHVNPVFQPANLALRNAWISGGVEWNIGMIGHTPLTVSPLFAEAFEREDGVRVLRMYEWERIRRAAYRLEAFLPEDSRFLFVRVEIVNTRGEEAPMYWWSNTAVNEAEGVRVIAPADRAFAFDYTRTLTKQDVPIKDGLDRSYTTRVNHAMDLFFDIPKAGQRKWECAVDEGGYGLIQASTDRLRGRKLFMWGKGPGGKRWQEFLAAPGHAYLEIQAGIAQTQMQCLPMPANARWDWLEAYGALHTDPKAAHGEWKAAYRAITRDLDGLLPIERLEGELIKTRAADAPATPMELGSGWAALERARLEAAGEPFAAGGLRFPDESMGAEQAPWLSLLNDGALPEANPSAEPVSYMIQGEWRELLKASIERGDSDHWLAWLHLGIMDWKAGDADGAKRAFERSRALTENAWAIRNLAAIRLAEGDKRGAAELALEAASLLPQKNLAIECGKLLLSAGLYAEFRAFERGLPEAIRSFGRFRVMDIEASIHTGETERALKAFGEDFTVNDVREGEVLLSDLWIQLHRKLMADAGETGEIDDARVLSAHPLPAKIDFRMKT